MKEKSRHQPERWCLKRYSARVKTRVTSSKKKGSHRCLTSPNLKKPFSRSSPLIPKSLPITKPASKTHSSFCWDSSWRKQRGRRTRKRARKSSKNSSHKVLREFFCLLGRRYPCDAFCFAKPRHLAAGVLPDFGIERFHQLLFCQFALQVQRDVFIFKPNLRHAFPRDSLCVEFFYFRDHAFFDALTKAFENSPFELFRRFFNADKKRIVQWIHHLGVRLPSGCYAGFYDLDGAHEPPRIVRIDHFRPRRVEVFKHRKKLTCPAKAGQVSAQFPVRFYFWISGIFNDRFDIQPRAAADDGELAALENILDGFVCHALVARDVENGFRRNDVKHVVGDASHFLFGDFPRSQVHAAIHLPK